MLKYAVNILLVSLAFAIALAGSLISFAEDEGDAPSPVATYLHPSFFAQLDAPAQDFLFRARNLLFEQPVSPDVALVGIDDYTQEKLGKYGTGVWRPRKPFVDQAVLFRLAYKPAVVAYDILFKEKAGSETSSKEQMEELRQEVARDLKAAVEEQGIDFDLNMDLLVSLSQFIGFEGDSQFSGEMNLLRKTCPVVLAAYFPDSAQRRWTRTAILGDDPDFLDEYEGTEVPYLRDVRIPMQLVEGWEEYPFYAHAAELPTNEYLDYVRIGYINVPRDEDSIIRRIPLILGMEYSFELPGKGTVTRRFFVPSLSLSACLHFWGIDLRAMNADEKYLNSDGKPVIEVKMGDAIIVRPPGLDTVRIPIDARGRMFLDYVGKVTDFATVPFAMSVLGEVTKNPDGSYSVKADTTVTKTLTRKLVMVGSSGTGGIDVGPCPVDANTPFVHVHMTAASNILMQTFLRPLGPREFKLVLGVLWLLVLPGAMLLRPGRFGYTALLLAIAYLAVVFHSVCVHRYMMPITGPLVFIGISYLTVLFFHYFTEEREKKRIRGMFSTMVSSDVLNYMEENPGSFSLAGERREATMFFSDVAGFTSISESLTPARLVELLNQYLSPMTDIIMASGGFVDKYEGDAIMAEWGVPYANDDHARLACWAALEQQARLEELRPSFKEEFGVDIHVRMGLNSGVVSAGNMGSIRRFSYTVMGDAVNQAARFEPANKDYGTLIMIGETTYELAGEHIVTRLLDKVIVKGKTVPIRIYELVAKAGEADETMLGVIELYHQGLEKQWHRDWDGAVACFEAALALRPEDNPSRTMLRRIESYRQAPPPEDWQGEYIRTSKD